MVLGIGIGTVLSEVGLSKWILYENYYGQIASVEVAKPQKQTANWPRQC